DVSSSYTTDAAIPKNYTLPSSESPTRNRIPVSVPSRYAAETSPIGEHRSQANHLPPIESLTDLSDGIEESVTPLLPHSDTLSRKRKGHDSSAGDLRISKGKQMASSSEPTRIYSRTPIPERQDTSNEMVMNAVRQLDEKVSELNYKVSQLLESHRRLIYLNTLDFNARQSKFERDPNYDYDYDL
ncbi:hypothetical protein BGZ76_006605, partial [Entomortierella beljakovae]